MPIFDALRPICIAAALIAPFLSAQGTLGAFELNGATAREALRAGISAYKSGDRNAAVSALRFAAERRNVPAMWKLASIYAEDGEANAGRAYDAFARLANDHAEEEPNSPNAPYVADAFVRLAEYHERGIPSLALAPNLRRAHSLYTHAAYYFRDGRAQHRLAQLYLDGIGTERNERYAARLFFMASRKGYVPAQAMLARLFIEGRGVARDPVKGLMWMTVAMRSDGETGAVEPLQDGLAFVPSEADRHLALAMAEDWMATQEAR